MFENKTELNNVSESMQFVYLRTAFKRCSIYNDAWYPALIFQKKHIQVDLGTDDW